MQITNAERSLIKSSKIAIPFSRPRPPKDAQYKLQYSKPASINAVGSYPLKIATRTGEELCIDLAVIMPSAIFQEKDYLNYRYLHKRAYYLACIAAGLKDEKSHRFKLSFDYLNGNHLLPVVLVRGNGDGIKGDSSASQFQIRIMPAISDGVFRADKLLPVKNCVRLKPGDDSASVSEASPTPFYNASVRNDCLVTSYLTLLHGASGHCEAFRDACILGRIWLRQRGLSSDVSEGGFGNFEWAAMVALLLQGSGKEGMPIVSTGYSSYQLFKAMLQYLASKDLSKHPQSFGVKAVILPTTDGTPVFFDGPRGVNILYKMTPWSYGLLRQEARSSIAMLNENIFDQFVPTFILRADPPLYRYDLLARIPVSSLGLPSSGEDTDEELDRICRKVYSCLSRGLTDRVSIISIMTPEDHAWDLGSRRSSQVRDDYLLIGFLVDPANANRAVDHGPPAASKKEAALYRQFWGDKAELRRFKDGSILESVVWSNKDSPLSVFDQIVQHVMTRHLGLSVAENVTFIGDSFDHMLPGGSHGVQPGVGAFQPTMSAFRTLETDMRALESLPLSLRHVQAADPQLRYASIDVPLLGSGRPMPQPADVVIQFEGSARWPDDLIAIQRTKIAFLLKLGELLEEAVDGLSARVGLESESSGIFNQSFLDVLYPTGAAFRIRTYHDREQTLIERRLKDKSLDGAAREEAAITLAAYKRDFLRSPTHTQTIQNLSTRFPMFSPSIRLVKKWFASHLLATHLNPELIELLVARAFLQPYPWQAPSSPMTGFLRTLLFLSRWDWRNEPLIVDLSGEMKSEEFSAITTRFEAWRKIDPVLNRVVLFVASSNDPEGTTWTDNAHPPLVVATRMTALAKAASQSVKQQGVNIEPESLFLSPLTDYDFVLRLSPQFTRDGQRRKNKGGPRAQYKNLQLQAASVEERELVGYQPVTLFLAELKDVYGHAITFFYDENGGDVVAGLWNPGTARRAWKVKLDYSTMPVSKKTKTANEEEDSVDVEINKEGILSEIARLGGDLVRKIEANRR